MRRRAFLCLGGGAALCGCAGGAVTPLPSLPSGAVTQASAEIDGNAPVAPRAIDDSFPRLLDRVTQRLEPPAAALCRELGVASCDWFVQGTRSHQVNASASATGRVAIHRGIYEVARNEEEFAFVVAHEMSHQAANHPRRGAADAQAGASMGALLGAALVVAGAAAGARPGAVRDRRVIEDYAGLGARAGTVAYSRDQEREADRLAVLLLYRAGYRPEAARGILLTMARASRRRETTIFDTHPAGPERLAAFDATLAELRAGNGAIPLRA